LNGWEKEIKKEVKKFSFRLRGCQREYRKVHLIRLVRLHAKTVFQMHVGHLQKFHLFVCSIKAIGWFQFRQ